MREAVEERAGEALAAEYFRPFVEGKVAGDHGGAAFVALGEDVEEEFSTGFRQWYEAEFVDDQELHFVE